MFIIYICTYIKNKGPTGKIFRNKKCFFLFYILCENFSKIGPIIKKIPNFVNDPLTCNSAVNKALYIPQ